MRRLLRRLRALARGRDNRRETMSALANNREAESGLWGRTAEGRPPGPGREKAIERRDERAEQARRLRGQEASLLRSLGLRLEDK